MEECYVIIQSQQRNALPWRLQTTGPQTEQGLEVKWYPKQTGVYVRRKAPGGSPFKALGNPTPSPEKSNPISDSPITHRLPLQRCFSGVHLQCNTKKENIKTQKEL